MKLYRIKKSNIDKNGRGLYATKDIKKGTRIIDYVGKIITKKQAEKSEKFDNSKPIYLFNLNNKLQRNVNTLFPKYVKKESSSLPPPFSYLLLNTKS